MISFVECHAPDLAEDTMIPATYSCLLLPLLFTLIIYYEYSEGYTIEWRTMARRMGQGMLYNVFHLKTISRSSLEYSEESICSLNKDDKRPKCSASFLKQYLQVCGKLVGDGTWQNTSQGDFR